MNIVDYNLLCVSLLTLFGYFYRFQSNKELKWSIIATAAVMPAILFSVDRTTSFLTVDEGFFVSEAIDLAGSGMFGLKMGVFWTTEMIIGRFFSLLNLLVEFPANHPMPKMIAKALHWYLGFLLILYIHFVLDKYFLQRENRKANCIFFIYLFILFPATNLALGIFNYDLLSMLCAVVGVLHLLAAIKNKEKRSALIAVVFAHLATQEKINAAPLFPLSILAYTYLAYRSSEAYSAPGFKARGVVLTSHVLWGTLVAWIVGLYSLLVLGMAHLGSISPLTLSAYPLVAWCWPVVQHFVHYTLEPIEGLRSVVFYVLGAQLIGIVVGAELIRGIETRLRKRPPPHPDMRKYGAWLIPAVFVLALFFGILGTYTPTSIAPVVPVPAGFYEPPAFNGWVVHFGEPGAFQHTLKYILVCFSYFFNALPTALLVLFVFTLWQGKNPMGWGWIIIGLSALSAPLLFGLTLSPVGVRYMNIPLALFLIFLFFRFDRMALRPPVRALLMVMTVLALFLEVAPFRPVHAAFRPIWSVCADDFNHRPKPGMTLGPAWMGWGEELMLAGKEIERMCLRGEIDCSDLRLYHFYAGRWLDRKLPILTFDMKRARGRIPFRFSRNDYFVFNRAVVTYDYVKNISETIENVRPFFTISHRGYKLAWVFRGDQLKK